MEELERRIRERISWLIVARDEAEKRGDWQEVERLEAEIINLRRVLE